MLAVPLTGKILDSPITEPAVVVSPITATAPPAYVAPTDPYIAPEPYVATTPDYQFRGEGGTPFGARPPAYFEPIAITEPIRYYPSDITLAGSADTVNKPTLPKPYILPPRPGEDQIMPVPTGQQPEQKPIGPAIEPVEKPGPVAGNVAGFNLARVPFWAWVVGAAFLGSRLLR